MYSPACLASLLAVALLATQPEQKEPTPAAHDASVLFEDRYILTTPVLRYEVMARTPAVESWSQLLGVSLADVDEPLRVQLGLKPQEGLLLTTVDAGGVAAQAGLQLHDVLLGLPAKVEEQRTLEVSAIRAGQRQRVVLRVARPRQYWIGVHTAELDDALRTQLSLPPGRGVVITEVIDQSPAQRAGLLRYDVVTGLASGTAIGGTEALAGVVQGSNGNALQLQIVRHAKTLTIGVTPADRPVEQSQQPDAEAVRNLAWKLVQAQRLPLHVTSSDQRARQEVIRWITTEPPHAPAEVQDPARQIAGLQKQVEQLLHEVSALRQTLEKQKQPDAGPSKK